MKEEETRRMAVELETAKRIEQQVTIRVLEESAKIADRVRQLTPLSPPPSSPSVTSASVFPVSTSPFPSATPAADGDATRSRSRTSSSASPSSSSSATAAAATTAAAFTTSINYLSANWSDPRQSTSSNDTHGATDSQPSTSNLQPYSAGSDSSNGPSSSAASDLHTAFDNSEFKMFEIGSIPPGPLGLALAAHKIELTSFLMSNVSTTLTIHVVIVKHSKVDDDTYPILSRSNFTLIPA